MPVDKSHFDSWLDNQSAIDSRVVKKTSDVGRSPAVDTGVGSALPKLQLSGGNSVRAGSAEDIPARGTRGGKSKNRHNQTVTFQPASADRVLPLTADVLQRVPVEQSPTATQQPSGSVAVGSRVSRASRASRASRSRTASNAGRQNENDEEQVTGSAIGRSGGYSPTIGKLGPSASLVSGATSACTPAVLPPGHTTSVDRRGDIHIHLPNALVGRGLPRFLSAYNPAYDRTPHTEKQDALVDLTALAEKNDKEYHRKKDWVKNYMEYMSRFGGTLLRGTTMVNQKG